MAQIRLKNVTAYRDRHGKTRYRFRKTGLPSRELHGEFGSPEFMLDLDLARNALPRKTVTRPRHVQAGSIEALLVRYFRSPDFLRLKANTQKNYKGVLSEFRNQYGACSLADLQRHDITTIMANMSDRPSAADNLLKRLKRVMRFALDEGLISQDPTLRVKGYNKRTEGFRTWTEQEIGQFKEHYASGSKERLALELLLCTAARRSDVVSLGWQHIKNGMIRVYAIKTRSVSWIPIHPDLQVELNALAKTNMTFLMTEYGKPFSIFGFGKWFGARTKMAGLESKIMDDGKMRGCTAHGLRKAAATRLADAGCTQAEIKAITGHTTDSEVARYTRERDQRLAAKTAMSKLQERQRIVEPLYAVRQKDA